MSEPIIELKDFGFQYNAQSKPTLYHIDLSIRKGEKILIAGPSGCGKSTMVHCFNGLIPFSYRGEMSGSLKLFGKETRDLSLFEISQHVGTVLQDSDAQFVGLTVAEDLAFALENDCIGEPELHERVHRIARRVNIAEFMKAAPGDLSGGQKQRVSVGGILVDDVDVLLFDEPLANLDPATGKQAVELIDEMQKITGAAVIIVEHRLEDVLHCPVDRVVLMEAGHIIADLSSDELLSSGLLKEHGIREPLYITALKYAGVSVIPKKKPSHIDTVVIDDADAAKVREWFMETPAAPRRVSEESVLRVDHLRFKYEKGSYEALRDISVDIRKGEMIAIVGTNGAGKTTFSKVICGFEEKTGGTILFCGEDFSPLSIKEKAEHVGYVMQNPNQMISKVMIYDEVAFGLQLRNIPEDEITERVNDALKICGLWKFRKWPISALSYGQKKRVTIASIIALSPEVIILDEPTAGQDFRHYTDIMEFLETLNRSGITVVMITHDMHLMLEYASRAIVFSDGYVIANDSCSSILTDAEIVKKASLKETSLYELAKKCGMDDPRAFVQRFIDYERTHVRGGGNEESL